MSELLVTTILIPLGLGLVLGLLGPKLGRVQTVLMGLALLGVYLLLEGVPAFPPVAGKQKLAYLLVLAIAVAHLPRPRIVVPLFLLASAIWLGWPKLSQGTLGIQALWLVVPALVSALPRPTAEGSFATPAALMVFALGAAVLSVLGVFMGFAQAMGAEAALLGGVLAVAWLRGLITGAWSVLAVPTQSLVLMGFGAMSLMIALFAPDISLPAYGVLSLALVAPLLAPRLAGLNPALQPFAHALLAAVPAGLAIALALASVTSAT